jgi:hypothetical protein
MPMQMQYGEHGDEIRCHRDEYAIRKIAHESSPDTFLYRWKLKGIVQESCEHRIDLRLKAKAETSALAFVPKCCLENLELRFRRDVEPPHLAGSAESGEQFVADFRPRTGSHFAASMRSKTIGDDLAMPIRNWHFLRTLSEMVP